MIKSNLKDILLFTSLLFISCKSTPEKKIETLSYQEVHEQAVLVDTHNDFLLHTTEKGYLFDDELTGKTHSDLMRMKQGGVDFQFFSIWCDGTEKTPYALAMRQMDSLDAVIQRNPDKMIKIQQVSELESALKQGKLAAVFGVEGGHMIEDDLQKLDTFYKRGVRYMTLTWNNSTDWATSAADETSKADLKNKGLTAFGKQIVHRMNDLGIMVDISHVGEETFWDVIETTTKPIMASHSSVHALCPHPRNLKDDQLKAIAKNNGVVQVNFYSGFIDPTYDQKRTDFFEDHKAENDSLINAGMNIYLAEEYLFAKYEEFTRTFNPPLSSLIDHIDHIVKLVGVNHVGLGSDFDGIPSAPIGLHDVTTFPKITEALVERGYSEDDIKKILGANIIRVLKANE